VLSGPGGHLTSEKITPHTGVYNRGFHESIVS
jgi:hypothetical protein